MKVGKEAARRFLVARHFLAPARSLAGGPEAVLDVFRKLGSIQFDPIAVAGRNHDLVLHARVAGYEPAWCDVLYERREIFETTNKALSFVPTSEFPWFRHVMGRKGPRFHGAILAENAAVAERVLERIRAEGPLSSLDFERENALPSRANGTKMAHCCDNGRSRSESLMKNAMSLTRSRLSPRIARPANERSQTWLP